MNTNNQILSDLTDTLDTIRKSKDSIARLNGVSAGLNGGSQQYITISAGGEKIEIGARGPSYSTIVRERYSLAATFIRKGIAAEIRDHELIVDLLTKKINSIKLEF